MENEDDVPLVWRAAELGKLEGPKAHHPGREEQRQRPQKPLLGELGEDVGESCVVEYDDECDERDYCVPEDERASAKGEYVSLVDNPERFTGYAGPGARQVWETIYRENCFSKRPENEKSAARPLPFGSSDFSAFRGPAAQELRSVIHDHHLQQSLSDDSDSGSESLDGLEFEDECLEKRVFYRIISGMHASISTHLCYNYLNTTTGTWSPNLACYEERLHKHPERISNIYFNYALVARAVGKVGRHIHDYVFCSADPAQDRRTQQLVLTLADAIASGPRIFDETLMFTDPDASTASASARLSKPSSSSSAPGLDPASSSAEIDLKDDFRARFRNVSRIMDCVGCDKCRLWGKLQTAGYGAALKVLFEFDENDSSRDPPLRRTELVALVNTLDRLSHSIAAAGEFGEMIRSREMEEERKGKNEADGKAGTEGKREKKKPESISDIFWKEWRLVWSAYAFVLRSWAEIPMKV